QNKNENCARINALIIADCRNRNLFHLKNPSPDYIKVLTFNDRDGSGLPGSEQEIAGAEPGDNQQAAGEFKQKPRKHPQGGA
ncbi:hypothetical protein EAJ17_13205, partial [Akkermansia sp. aa_0143]